MNVAVLVPVPEACQRWMRFHVPTGDDEPQVPTNVTAVSSTINGGSATGSRTNRFASATTLWLASAQSSSTTRWLDDGAIA